MVIDRSGLAEAGAVQAIAATTQKLVNILALVMFCLHHIGLENAPEAYPALVGRIEIDFGFAPLPRPAVATEQLGQFLLASFTPDCATAKSRCGATSFAALLTHLRTTIRI